MPWPPSWPAAPVALLERLAGMIADRVLAEPHVAEVSVTVRKPHVAIPHTVRRERRHPAPDAAERALLGRPRGEPRRPACRDRGGDRLARPHRARGGRQQPLGDGPARAARPAGVPQRRGARGEPAGAAGPPARGEDPRARARPRSPAGSASGRARSTATCSCGRAASGATPTWRSPTRVWPSAASRCCPCSRSTRTWPCPTAGAWPIWRPRSTPSSSRPAAFRSVNPPDSR